MPTPRTATSQPPRAAAGGAPPAARMSRDDRREQLLDAAVAVVARSGFTGATTDDVARAAGVSQPYVVRLFGTKAGMLEAVYARVGDRVLEAFCAVPPGPGADHALGRAYLELVSDRDLLRVLLHGFSGSADPALAARARAVLAEVFRLHRDRTGGDEEAARAFVADGMLMNVLLAVGVPEHLDDDADLAALARCALGEKLAQLAPPAGRA